MRLTGGETRQGALREQILRFERERALERGALLVACFGHCGQRQPDLGDIGLARGERSQQRARRALIAVLTGA